MKHKPATSSPFEWKERESTLAPELAVGGKRSADASGVIDRKRKVDPYYGTSKAVRSRGSSR